MRRRTAWSLAAVALLAVLATELYLLVDRTGGLDRPLPASVETLRRALLPPTMSVHAERPPMAPVVADAYFGGLLGRDQVLLLSGNEARDLGPLTRRRLAVEALRDQSAEQSRTAESADDKVAKLRAKPATRNSPVVIDLRWLLRANGRVAQAMWEAADGMDSGDEALVQRLEKIPLLGSLRADAVLERFGPEFEGFAGAFSNGGVSNPGGSRAGMVELVIAVEAHRLVAERGITGREAALIEKTLVNKLRLLLQVTPRLTPQEWRTRAQVALLEATRGSAAGIAEKRPVIKARLVVPDWTLRGATTDMTIRVSDDSRVQGTVSGFHVRPADDAIAHVTARFTGRMDEHGTVSGQGTYEVDATAGQVSSIENGRFTISGYPTRNGFYLGSVTLQPFSPPEADKRTLLWEEPAVRGSQSGG